MECFYKRDLKKSYMVLEGEFEEIGYEQEVLKNNTISVLLPFYTVNLNNKMQIWYDITGMITLQDYILQQGITIELIRKVLLYLNLALEEINKYLINIKYIMFAMDFIYVIRNQNQWKIMLAYCPVEEENNSIDSLFEFFMNNVDDKELMDVCFELYDRSVRGESINMLLDYIDEKMDNSVDYVEEDEIGRENEYEIELERENDSVENNILKSDSRKEEQIEEYDEFLYEYGLDNYENEQASIIDKIIDYVKKYIKSKLHKSDKEAIKKDKDIKAKKKFFDKKPKLEDFEYEPDMPLYEPTVLLKSAVQNFEGELEYIGNNNEDNYLISKNEFAIGSATKGNDAVLHSPVVSRFHAKIYKEGNSFFIEDLNSTNGTYVNGELLSYKERVELFQKDKIMFADVCYRIV